MDQKQFLILAVNPGSTSTKIAVFRNEDLIVVKTVHHSRAELEQFEDIWQQEKMRLACVLEVLKETGISPSEIGRAHV